jgi:hypothetical protein
VIISLMVFSFSTADATLGSPSHSDIVEW